MRVVFRVDSSFQMGSGHLVRCLTLARGLRVKGADVLFICRNLSGNFIELIIKDNFNLKILDGYKLSDEFFANDSHEIPHASWLEVDWRADVHQTVEALANNFFDWLIVDHYGLGEKWESQIRPYVRKIMVIDDLADRVHDCDFLLDQNYVPDLHNRYDKKIPMKSDRFIGPKYALLRPDYASQRIHKEIVGDIKTISVFFGGVDRYNLTQLAIEAFIDLKRIDLQLNVLFDSRNQFSGEILDKVREHPNIVLTEPSPSLINFFFSTDLAIGAVGATTWERCCFGLPSIVVSVAENQRSVAEKLYADGYVNYLGHYDALSKIDLTRAMNDMLGVDSLSLISKKCRDLVDGGGVDRVIEYLLSNSLDENKL